MNPQYTIATNQYGHYCIPLSSAHRPCAKTILAGDVHEPDTIQYILDNCGDGDVIHAGAYFGDMLPALGNIRGGVWALEPNPDNFRCASANMRLNDVTGKVLLRSYALGNRTGYANLMSFDIAGRSLGGGSKTVWSKIGKQNKDKFIQVVTRRIDHLLHDPNISIIHLDIEGSEQLALTGAMDTITRCKPILILETLPSDEWTDRNLTGLGYRIIGKVHGNSILECVK